MLMQWSNLLASGRPGRRASTDGVRSEPDYRTAFEADCDRVVYSAPFRRLARKTQVHPMAVNDHVHNRLTHSIEVASVGRSFGRRLGAWLCQRGEIQPDRIEDVCQILQAACLAHDIGNPPFGHAGEFAIRQWVRDHEADLLTHDTQSVSPGVMADWRFFEGNAQGFRLAARADNPKTGYMHLTHATLGAMIKYPWDSQDAKVRQAGQEAKFNVFSTEAHLFERLTTEMHLRRPDGSAARHPLSFLSEAADDICYRILDLEDAVDMDILDERKVRQVFLGFLRAEDTGQPLSRMRGQVIRTLMDRFWRAFEDDFAAIAAGKRTTDLKADVDDATKRALEPIKDLYALIFANRAKVATELGAYETLGRIIQTFVQAVRVLTERGAYDRTDFLTRRRLELAWGAAYAESNQSQPYDWWLHQVMDYVAGLTDNAARRLARDIAGL